MAYEDLVKFIKSRNYRMTRLNVVSLLIGLKGYVDESDWDNINRAYQEDLIED